jgi:hypothetical protein
MQSLDLGNRFAVRHATTFAIGLAGLGALLPLGRLVAGRWAGLTAIVLSLSTGYLYGNLFFSTIDVPFLAAMTWTVTAIVFATRSSLPNWSATVLVGIAIGFAIGTRPGGVIGIAYFGFALTLAAAEYQIRSGSLPARYIIALSARFLAALTTSIIVAIAIWPWLQIGNTARQFLIALRHFNKIPMSYEFFHWGARVRTDALPVNYVLEQLAARLSETFLLLLGIAVSFATLRALNLARRLASGHPFAFDSDESSRMRALMLVSAAAAAPIALTMIQHTKLYDGIRHLLFVIPMLAVIASAAFVALIPTIRHFSIIASLLIGACVGSTVVNTARLHPLEYVAMNVFAGGTAGAVGRFELDYSSVAAGEAVRQLEHRVAYTQPVNPPAVMVCIPWREWAVKPLLKPGWTLATDIDAADYVIETERWRCASGRNGLHLIDEVLRVGRPFAWIYARTHIDKLGGKEPPTQGPSR